MTETSPEEYRERRRRLAQALRSDEFKPARGYLRKGDCFCVLGVVCEMYRREAGTGEWVPNGLYYIFKVSDTDDYSSSIMPTAVRNYYGFTTHAGHYWTEDGRELSLMEQNDDRVRVLPLTHFADIVENPPTGLFLPEAM